MTTAKRISFGALGLLILAPCFWLPQIQSVDLASHLYNAWIAQLVREGEITGLYLARQHTNILFDVMLSSLLPILGKQMAGSVAVAVCVSVLFSGSIALMRHAAGRTPWHSVASLSMLCYGFVYHMGLFNFYLSLGFCLWFLAFIWKQPWRRWIWGAPLLVAGVIAHPFPVFWAAGMAGYLALARHLPFRHRLWTAMGTVFAILLARLAIQLSLSSYWDLKQILYTTGVDQALVFEKSSIALSLIWLAWWCVLFSRLVKRYSWRRVVYSLPFILVCLNAAGIFFIPTRILPPGYSTALVLISERMSLPQGILVCVLLARVPDAKWLAAVSAGLALIFFASNYTGEKKLTRLEESVEQLLEGVPKGTVVLSGLCWPDSRFNAAYHLVDRACIGRCFQFGNFEPASGQFRLRAAPGNRYAVDRIGPSYAYEYEEFVYQPKDVATYRVEGLMGSEPRLRKLEPGMRLQPPCPQQEGGR